MGLLKDIVMPGISAIQKSREKKRSSGGGTSGGSDEKRSSDSGGFYGSAVTSYKRGGRVKRTGMAKVHRGERVLTRKQAQAYRHKRSSKR